MELVSRLSTQEKEAFEQDGRLPLFSFENRQFTLPNCASLLWKRPQPGDLELVVKKKALKNLDCSSGENGAVVYSVKQFSQDDIERVQPADRTDRTCVLMNTSMIDEKWVRPALSPLIQPDDEVCVLAFSFFDDTKNVDDWNRQYRKGQGIWYRANTDVFYAYGLKEDQIHWVNYFLDSPAEMKNAIARSNILLLTGGAPDLMMKRIREKKLTGLLKNYRGLVIGYSAGAMVQMKQYHITPDEDYAEYSWNRGFGYLKGFDVEVHYRASAHQKQYIHRAMSEKRFPVYAIYEQGGMIVLPDGEKQFFGQVDLFEPEEDR